MEIIKKLKTYTFLVSIFYIIMGLIMLLNPKFICDAVNYIVGILILIYGIIYIAKFLSKNDFNNLSKFNLLAGLLCIVFGAYILLNPTVLLSIIPFATGMLILLDGFGKLKNAIDLKKVGYLRWWISLVISILFIGLGIYMVFQSFKVTELVVRIIGGILIIDALSDVWTYFCYKKYSKKIEKIMVDANVKEANIVEYKEK
ncbi:MAG: DUF308 domain-containing protein [Bacilli bacterium]|nr:DUF308 domain-containing protein [Bacilli bacterium]